MYKKSIDKHITVAETVEGFRYTIRVVTAKERVNIIGTYNYVTESGARKAASKYLRHTFLI